MLQNLPKIKTALITGASSGLGYEFAKIFAKNNHNLVLVARSHDKLNAISKELESEFGIKSSVITCDLSQPGAAAKIEQEVNSLNIHVDYLVNNAGFANYGMFQDSNLKKESDCIQVNVTALTELTQIFLPKMIQNNFGGILNVASTAAFQPGPLMAVYFATKAYVTSFSSAISNELEGSGVHVSVLCPGPTKTNFFAHANMENTKLTKSLLPVANSANVALIGYKGFIAKKKTIIPGILNQIGVCSNRFIGRNLSTKITRKFLEK